jgi:hypothetical protein
VWALSSVGPGVLRSSTALPGLAEGRGGRCVAGRGTAPASALWCWETSRCADRPCGKGGQAPGSVIARGGGQPVGQRAGTRGPGRCARWGCRAGDAGRRGGGGGPVAWNEQEGRRGDHTGQCKSWAPRRPAAARRSAWWEGGLQVAWSDGGRFAVQGGAQQGFEWVVTTGRFVFDHRSACRRGAGDCVMRAAPAAGAARRALGWQWTSPCRGAARDSRRSPSPTGRTSSAAPGLRVGVGEAG